jgi:hypothetical protein
MGPPEGIRSKTRPLQLLPIRHFSHRHFNQSSARGAREPVGETSQRASRKRREAREIRFSSASDQQEQLRVKIRDLCLTCNLLSSALISGLIALRLPAELS